MAERKFLDLTGLSTLWDSIKAKIPTRYASSKTEGGAADKAVSIPFGQVDSTSTSTVFTATVDGITELRDGVCVYLRNGVVTSASGCTLNVNQLGAKPIYASNAAETGVAKLFASAVTMLFVYNSSRIEGGCWDMYYGYNSNTDIIGYQLRTNSLTLPMAQKVYRYRLLFTSADGTKWVGANTSTSTNATASRTPNQTKIDPFGKIVYYGSTTVIDANKSPGATVLWSQYVITLGYSFNNTGAALALDIFKPVYIKCTPQPDGSAIIDETTPFTQSLPSTADGKIYIFLGIAVTVTTVEVVPGHPIYCYRNGGLQIWTGVQAEIDALNIPSASSSIPQALGTASPGNSSDYSRADHVHPTPSASDVGALPSNTSYVSTVNGQSGAVTVSVPSDYVAYSSQSLTDAQKTQARTNIGAGTYTKPSGGIPASDLASGVIPETFVVNYRVSDLSSGVNATCDKTFAEVAAAIQAKIPLIAYLLLVNTVIGVSTSVRFDGVAYFSISGLRSLTNELQVFDIAHGSDSSKLYIVAQSPSSVTPQALGTASAGSARTYSRSDHVHAMPTASDVGAIAAPSSPATGAFLVWNGSAWTAQTLATWQGGNY